LVRYVAFGILLLARRRKKHKRRRRRKITTKGSIAMSKNLVQKKRLQKKRKN